MRRKDEENQGQWDYCRGGGGEGHTPKKIKIEVPHSEWDNRDERVAMKGVRTSRREERRERNRQTECQHARPPGWD